MAIKQMIGAVMKELGFVTKDQLEAALSIQSRIAEEKLLPETRERSSLVSEARYSSQSNMIPLLGNLLLDLGHITEDQLLEALKTQTSLLEKYRGLQSDALFSVLDLGALVNSSLNLAEVEKHRVRYGSMHHRSDFRTVFHDQGQSGRYRSRPCRGGRDRKESQWIYRCPEYRERGDPGGGVSAADRSDTG
jgi:hypothetical protein